MTTLLHCADLHLEASFAAEGLPPAAGNRRRSGLRQALSRTLALAVERQVDAVTIAGDLYEDAYAGPEAAAFLAQEFAAAAPIPILIAPGEHDPWHEDSLYALTRWPDNVHIFPPGALSRRELAAGVRLWGAAHPLPPQLLRSKVEGAPQTLPLSSSTEPTGSVTFAPCPDPPESDGLDLLLLHAGRQLAEESLPAAGFDLALLGGEHMARTTPLLVYPGSPEPLSRSEAEGEHTVALVTLEDGACRVEPIAISQGRCLDLTADLSGCSSLEDAVALIGLMLRGQPEGVDEATWVRVTLIGARRFDLDLAALRAGVDTPAWVDYTLQLAPAYDPEAYVGEPTARGWLVERFRAQPAEGDEAAQLALNLALRALDGRRVRAE